MMTASDSIDLSTKILAESKRHPDQRLCFKVDPSRMTARLINRRSSPAPLITGHGDEQSLASVLHTFHQWGAPIYVGSIWTPALTQFWVERSEDDDEG